MKIIGLSGGVASGKNFIAEIFAKKGAAVFDADKEVHNLLKSDSKTISEIKEHFPESFINNKIDRKILGKMVFGDQNKLQKLEEIIHPKVKISYQKFLKKAHQQNKKLSVLNIPLLLEKGGYKCDKIIAITVSEKTQKQRFLRRYQKLNPNSFLQNYQQIEQNFYAIKSKQLSNIERKKKANFVVFNSLSRASLIRQINEIYHHQSISKTS